MTMINETNIDATQPSKLSNRGAKPLARYAGSALTAAALTFALGVTMALMIKTDFIAAEKTDLQAFEINPEIVDIELPRRVLRPDALVKVDIPPAAPRIATAKSPKPDEPPIVLKGDDKVDWTPPVISKGGPIIQAADTNETPLYRSEPVMPPRAQRSGHCIMQFNVSAEGAPYDINAQSCSDKIFARPSIKAVSKWKYRAKVQEGQRVARTGLTTRLTFRLSDGAGKLIPE